MHIGVWLEYQDKQILSRNWTYSLLNANEKLSGFRIRYVSVGFFPRQNHGDGHWQRSCGDRVFFSQNTPGKVDGGAAYGFYFKALLSTLNVFLVFSNLLEPQRQWLGSRLHADSLVLWIPQNIPRTWDQWTLFHTGSVLERKQQLRI